MRFQGALDAYGWYRSRRYALGHPEVMPRSLYRAGPAGETAIALADLERLLGRLGRAGCRALHRRGRGYAEAVARFEPSKRWEEAVLVLAMIQGMRFKNQLFNHHWAEGSLPGEDQAPLPDMAPATPPAPVGPTASKRPHRGKVLPFRPKDDGGES